MTLIVSGSDENSLRVMGMRDEFEGCEHLLDGLYGFALGHRIPLVAVDDEVDQAYWRHKRLYERLSRYSGFERELKLRSLNVHVLEGHVLSGLEKMAGGEG
jgi:hypothetical protein